MVKNLNLKNIKATMETLYKEAVDNDCDFTDYNKFYNALYTLYSLGFIDYDMSNKICRIDDDLFDKYSV